MFDKIQHIGYLTSDLEAAVAWFERSFGAVTRGRRPLSPSYAVPSGGRNAYLRFGQAEAEIIEPETSPTSAARSSTCTTSATWWIAWSARRRN